ncbi:deazapurine DNA modification protein DpdA family protein [Pseudonocardia sp. T1-2H]|uniref:deazapurine DNA modification protein DpdA family protein n=1 Tax=Pseudonocardia sp. T1-2H TaxID=3128899 RepID=UPI003100C2D9
MTFYLGCPEPSWLRRTSVPLFISRTRLSRVIALPEARGPWALDSGGFSELRESGRWTISPQRYADEVRGYIAQLGEPDFAAPQDWMCEDDQLARTGLTLQEHQVRTVLNYAVLRQLAPEVPWLPVLQGVTVASYLRCAAMYEAIGVHLADEPRVGVGSVCRRQATVGAAVLFDRLVGELGLRNLHGFGLKADGLDLFGEQLASADSMAWSYGARRDADDPDRAPCPDGRTDCRNCLHEALAWRERVLASWAGARGRADVPPVVAPRLRPRREPAQTSLFSVLTSAG